MATTLVSKQMVIKPGLWEYTASGTIALPRDYVEMCFNRQVRISQIYWKWTIPAYWQLWLVDSEGMMQLIDEDGSSYGTEYVLNYIPSSGSLPPRYFDVPAGGKLRLEVRYNDTSGGGATILSCIAES